MTKDFTINKIEVLKDKADSFIIGFIIYSENENYHFIRLTDEINFLDKTDFNNQISNAQ